MKHVLHLATLPAIHKDPFDRLLEAQANLEGWQIVSHDPAIKKYPIEVIW
jgi:PIN domain nuclease of toxin-antitoxin system